MAEVAIAQHNRSRSFTAMYTSSIPNPGVLFKHLHLPEESAVASAYIENNSSTANLKVYEGSGGTGRVVGVVKSNHSKRIAFADHLSSISVLADVADLTSALVIVTLSTHKWSPQQSSLA